MAYAHRWVAFLSVDGLRWSGLSFFFQVINRTDFVEEKSTAVSSIWSSVAGECSNQDPIVTVGTMTFINPIFFRSILGSEYYYMSPRNQSSFTRVRVKGLLLVTAPSVFCRRDGDQRGNHACICLYCRALEVKMCSPKLLQLWCRIAMYVFHPWHSIQIIFNSRNLLTATPSTTPPPFFYLPTMVT